MASGDTLAVFVPLHNEPPATIAATLDIRNNRLALDFNDAADEEAVFTGIMPQHYSNATGITIHIWWGSATDQTTGDVDWEFAFERIITGVTDLDVDSFATAQNLDADAPGTASLIVEDTLAITKGANMDSIVAGDLFRLKVRRDADDATNDDMDGDAELYAIEIRET